MVASEIGEGLEMVQAYLEEQGFVVEQQQYYLIAYAPKTESSNNQYLGHIMATKSERILASIWEGNSMMEVFDLHYPDSLQSIVRWLDERVPRVPPWYGATATNRIRGDSSRPIAATMFAERL